MAADSVKKAAEMLLSGARMVSEPCPYCGGVRVMRGGHAFCSSCGSEPEAGREAPPADAAGPEERLAALAARLATERDEGARRAILAEISAITAKMSGSERG
ncbi:MAG: autoantigen p27 domain-containing protein [Thaumarchaeota archaeon]|nr:autoantigen p27 domain-containing protein [Nitrososphaerota archaeon]